MSRKVPSLQKQEEREENHIQYITNNQTSTLKLAFFNIAGRIPSLNALVQSERPDICLATEIRKRKKDLPVSGNIIRYTENNMKGLLSLNCSSGSIIPLALEYTKNYQIITIMGIIIISVYKAPRMHIQEFLTDLAPMLEKYHGEAVIIGGDFNINSGTTKFDELSSFLLKYNIYWKAQDSHHKSFVGHQGSSLIDHLFVNTKAEQMISRSFFSNSTYGSDHRPLIVDLRSPDPITRKTILNTGRLKYGKIRKHFVRLIELHLNHLDHILEFTKARLHIDPDLRHLDEFDAYLNSTLTYLAEKALGGKRITVNKEFAFNDAMLNVQKEYRILLRRYKHGQVDYEAVRCKRRDLKTMRKNAEKKQLESIVQNMNFAHNSKQTSSIKRWLNPRSTRSTDPDVIDNLATGFQKRFKGMDDAKSINFNISAYRGSENIDEMFDEGKIIKLVKRLNPKKASGFGQVTLTIIQPIINIIAPLMSKYFKLVFEFGAPQSWREFRTILLNKNLNLDPKEISNYRPIALGTHCRKIFEVLLLDKISPSLSDKIHPHQNGFRHHRGCIDHCAILDFILRKEEKVDAVFLDIAAAYDSVWRPILWQKLQKMGLAPDLIRCLSSLFDHNFTFLDFNGTLSKPIVYEAGLQQGSILSPLLYSLFINDLTQELEKAKLKTKINVANYRLCSLFFADDISLLTAGKKRRRDMQQLLDICQAHSERNFYRFSTRKTKAMTFRGDGQYRIYNEVLEEVDSFKYLGILFGRKGINWEEHFTFKFAKVRKFCFMINCKPLNLRARISIFRTFIRPKFEYGVQLLSYYKNNKTVQKLEAFQYECLQKLINLYGVNANRDRLYALLNIDHFSCRIADLKYSYYESMQFKDDTNVTKILFYNSDGVTTMSRMYHLCEDIIPTYDSKGVRITGQKLRAYNRTQRFIRTCKKDKVLECAGITTVVRFSFIYKLPYQTQKLILRFLLRRFYSGDCRNLYSLKLCPCCNEYKDIEHHVKSINQDYRKMARKILNFKEPYQLREITPLIKSIL